MESNRSCWVAPLLASLVLGLAACGSKQPSEPSPRAPGIDPADVLLSGTVVDAAGRPCVGATVRLSDRYPAWDRAIGWWATTQSNAQGRYSFQGIRRPGPRHPFLLLAAFTQDSYAEYRIASLPPHAQVHLQLRRGPTMQGVAVDGEGRPLPGASIHAQDLGDSLLFLDMRDAAWKSVLKGTPQPRRLIKCDEQGRFDFAVARRSTWIVSGTVPGRYLRERAVWSLEDRETPSALTLVFDPAQEIGGRILTKQGVPVTRAIVRAVSQNSEFDESPASTARSLTRADGRFGLSPLRPGRYRVTVELPKILQSQWREGQPWGHLLAEPRITETVAAGTKQLEWTIGIPATGSLRLQISPTAPGPEIVSVRLSNRFGTAEWLATAQDGALSLPSLPTGSHRLQLRITRLATWKEKIQIESDRETDLGTLTLREHPLEVVQFLDAQQRPIQGVWVQTRGIKGSPSWLSYRENQRDVPLDAHILATSNERGLVELPLFEERDPYSVESPLEGCKYSAYKPGYYPKSLSLDVTRSARGRGHLQVTLEPCAEIRIQLPPSSQPDVERQSTIQWPPAQSRWVFRLCIQRFHEEVRAADPGMGWFGSGLPYIQYRWAVSSSARSTGFLGVVPMPHVLEAYNPALLSDFVEATVPGRSFYKILDPRLGEKIELTIH